VKMKNVGWIYKPEQEFGHELNREKRRKKIEKGATELRKLVREYLDCIADVPMRAVDCNQTLEESLRANLAKAANYKGNE